MQRRRGELVETGPAGLLRVAEAMTSPTPGAVEAALDALDPADWAALSGLIGVRPTRGVQRARSRSGDAKRGHVVLLPGIMGTDLAVIGTDGLPSLVWFSLKALAGGGLDKLKVPLDGSEPDPPVQPGGLMKLFYLSMQVRIGVHWHAQLFPYDWRLDIDVLADQLDETVRPLLGQPVHLVAHSLGGLVGRAMIRQHPDTWQAMRIGSGGEAKGGRLVMLGTPNRGSFAPVLAFAGRDLKIRGLALMDRRLRKDDVVGVVATFPGMYQMLPSKHASLGDAVDGLYSVDGWPEPLRPAVHQRLLDRAGQFHDDMEEVVDVDRMVYVAGFGHRTVDGIDGGRGKLKWHRSYAGDGTVSHALGRLPGVPTFWSTASHGSLAKDDVVLAAIDDLLTDGSTSRLPSGDQPPATRSDDGDEWVDDDDMVAEVDVQAADARTEGDPLLLLSDVVPMAVRGGTAVPQVALRIDVVWGDVGASDADVVAVGHYQDVYPTAAEAALDRSLSGDVPQHERLLHAATARGVLTGALGEIVLYPRLRASGAQGLAAVVGMGRTGRFGLAQHEVAVRNLLWTCERAASATSLAMVLIGSGSDNLGVAETVENLLRTLDVAVREQDLVGTLGTLQIVEQELGRADRICAALRSCISQQASTAPALVAMGGVIETSGGIVHDATALERLLPSMVARATAADVAPPGASARVREAVMDRIAALKEGDLAQFNVRPAPGVLGSEVVPTRLSVLVRDGEIWVTAISDTATVPERALGLELDVFEALVARANAEAGDDLERAGEMLLQLAVPSEFRQLLQAGRKVVVEVDKHTAALPWELLGDGGPGPSGNRALGLRTPLARQLRSPQSAAPGVTGRLALRHALVIGDPGGRDDASGLAGARREALAVEEVLRDHGVEEVELLLAGGGDPVHAGAATLPNVLHHLIHRRYDLVHYAGHGIFSTADAPDGSGWMLADRLFKGCHLVRASRLPALVVANACHSSRVSTGLPGLADEFIAQGVRNLVGTARTVTDDGAEAFCRAFYSVLMTGVGGSTGSTSPALGHAILAGRHRLSADGYPDWDAYQLYGDPDFRFWDNAQTLPPERGGR